jgi:hypothetical protein
MKLRLLLAASAVASAAAMSAPASAAIYAFDLTGAKTASFNIDTATAPTSSSSSFIGDQISYNAVTGTFGGTTQTATIGFGTFLAAQLNIGGTTLGFTQYGGPDLFSLVSGAPVFNLGSFNLSSITSGPATITIRAVSGAVPEPATWAMMLVGFGAIGFSMRRRNSKSYATA